MTAHARLSPSGSKRWLACPGSIVMESAFPNTGNEYSDDGVAMHSVAGDCLQSIVGLQAEDFLDDLIEVQDKGEPVRNVKLDDGMVELTQGYIDDVRARATTSIVTFIEQRVDFSAYVDVLDQQFGTADAIFLHPIVEEPDCYELEVEDLKTGYHFVDVERNSQLMIYALGAYLLLELSYTITRVRLTIYQPRHGGPREWTCSIEELLKFAEELKAGAQKVEHATALHGTTMMNQEKWEKLYLHPTPNEQDCAFCRAMSTCPAYRRQLEAVVGVDFDVIAEQSTDPAKFIPVPDDPAKLSRLMAATGMLEDLILAVRAEVERRLLLDLPVEGFGLELGRQGNRKWKSTESAETLLRKTFRLKIEDAFDMSLKSPTSIEAMAKVRRPTKANPNPPAPLLTEKQWKKAQALIIRADAKPSVKPVAQIKTPYSVTKPDAGDFEVVNEHAVRMAEITTIKEIGAILEGRKAGKGTLADNDQPEVF